MRSVLFAVAWLFLAAALIGVLAWGWKAFGPKKPVPRRYTAASHRSLPASVQAWLLLAAEAKRFRRQDRNIEIVRRGGYGEQARAERFLIDAGMYEMAVVG